MSIQGVNCVRKLKADGSAEYRYYAWRGKGAPCFWVSPHRHVKQPFPRAFVEAYQEAMKNRHDVRDDFNGMATRYLESPGHASLAEKTRSDYRKLIDKAREQFGVAPLQVIADPRFRAEIIRYRDSLRDHPRTADLSVLGVHLVLEHARNLGLLGSNPAAGIPSLYSRPDDKRPWSDAEMARFAATCEPQVLDAFNLIRLLALRRKDAIAITWAADKGTHIAWGTSKGKRHRREAVIPILPEARKFLDELRRKNSKSVTMLATRKGTPWSDEGSITRAFRQHWLDLLGYDRASEAEAPETPTPHRLRNNAATAYIMAGLDDRTIADAMGWSARDVEEMRRVYVDREAVVSAAVIRLRDAR